MGKKNRMIAIVTVIIVILIGLYFVNRYWIAPATLKQQTSTGKFPTAPAFTVTDIHGQKLSLDSFRGKVVLLNFWATWCGPCRDEIPGFVGLQEKYGAQGFQIIGISMDHSIDPVRPFYSQFHMNYPVAMNNQKLVAHYFPHGIYGYPTSFLIGRDGHIYDEVPGEVNKSHWETEIQELLAAPSDTVVADFKPAGESAQPEVETPAEANSEVPGIDLTKLSKTEVAAYKDALSKQKCTCGCSYNVLQCRIHDSLCATSAQLAKAQLAKMQKPNPAQ